MDMELTRLDRSALVIIAVAICLLLVGLLVHNKPIPFLEIGMVIGGVGVALVLTALTRRHNASRRD